MKKKLIILGILMVLMLLPNITSAAGKVPSKWYIPGYWSGRGLVGWLWDRIDWTIAKALYAIEMATNLITASRLADNSVGTSKLANNAVTDDKVVDTITASNYLPLAGGTMTGALNMGSQNIIGVGTVTFKNGETLDNATDGFVKITSPVLVQAYDAAAYWTATQADTGAVTFDSVSDGTAGFTFSDPVTFNATPTGGPGWTTAFNTSISSATVGTLGWLEFTSTATSGDITGLRPRVKSTATSDGSNVRGTYSEAICGASGNAALLQGVLATASVASGNCTAKDVHVLAGHFSTGVGANITGDLYVGMLRAQTRGDETVAGNDVLLGLVNEAVGGAGRQMDSAIRIFATNVTTPTAFNYGIDMSGAAGEIGTADIRLSSGAMIISAAGAPAGGCTTGSLYLDSAGGANTTLYVCEAGAWAAK